MDPSFVELALNESLADPTCTGLTYVGSAGCPFFLETISFGQVMYGAVCVCVCVCVCSQFIVPDDLLFDAPSILICHLPSKVLNFLCPSLINSYLSVYVSVYPRFVSSALVHFLFPVFLALHYCNTQTLITIYLKHTHTHTHTAPRLLHPKPPEHQCATRQSH
jgi:hypothetical protein